MVREPRSAKFTATTDNPPSAQRDVSFIGANYLITTPRLTGSHIHIKKPGLSGWGEVRLPNVLTVMGVTDQALNEIYFELPDLTRGSYQML